MQLLSAPSETPGLGLAAEIGHTGVVKNIATASSAPTGASQRVARLLLEGGPATASDLARRLKLTPAAVRRQLDSLEAAGHIKANERPPYGPTPPRGRGRPAKVYTLTASGRDAFDQAYDDVAIDALRYLVETGGQSAVLDFARRRVAETERRYEPIVSAGATQGERIELLAQALTSDGFAAGVEPTGDIGSQICQHHCPVAHVAEEFPQFCEAEAEAFSRLVGTHVTRLATLASGDGVCTTLVPHAPTQSRRPERTTA